MSTAAQATRRGVLVLLLALYAALALAALLSDSSVADEHPHILSGWLFWESGRYAGGVDNPPLGQLLVAAPYRLPGVDYRFPDDAQIGLARLPVVMLLLALAVLVGRWTTALAGSVAGLVALSFLCLEPNLLAHGHLATLDVPLTFFWWAALWGWRRVLQSTPAPSGGVAWGALAAFFVALALASFTKFTGLLLLAVCALLAIVGCPGGRRAGLRLCVWLAVTVAGLLLVSHLFYGFDGVRYGVPAAWVDAVRGKWAHRDEGHFAYLMGRRSVTGFPEYYLVTLLVKTPLPLLALAITGLVTGWRTLSRLDRALLVVPAAVIVAAFSIVGVNIGVRHILPVYPALVIAAAIGAQFAWRRRQTRVILMLACAAWVLGIARVVPQQLAYFNCIAGGASRGHRWLLDSNLDWGQDEKRLRGFLSTATARGETWDVNPASTPARTGRLVVGANTLHNLLRRDGQPYAWLRLFPSAGHAGYSWHRYELDVQDFEELVARRPDDAEARIALAEVLASAGRWQEAADHGAALLSARGTGTRLWARAVESALGTAHLDAARRWLQRGLELHPNDPALRSLAERMQFEAIVRDAAAADDVARAQAALALWWVEHGDVERAVDLLAHAARALPAEVEVVRALGVAEARLGNFAAATAVFERPAVAAALRREANACRALAATEAALGDAAARPPRSAWMDLATTHVEDRRYDRAAAALVEILRDDAGDAEALALLAEIHVRAKLHIVDDALTPRAVRHANPSTAESR